MRIRPASQEERARAVSFLQCPFWGDFKALFGWKSLRFVIEDENSSSSLLVLVRGLRLGLSFAYVPHGPDVQGVHASPAAFLAELSEALKPFLPSSCVFIRFDPPWIAFSEDFDATRAKNAAQAENEPMHIGSPLVRAVSDVQVPDTIIVDLSVTEEQMLARMKSKWRYNIRLAAKRGVEVVEAGVEAVPAFYRLYRITASRDKIALHPETYYRSLFEICDKAKSRGDPDSPDVRLWIARKDGKDLAAIMTLFRGSEAVYLYGASADEGRELMPAYALQWAAMRAAKQAGCSSYDLFGVPPSDDPDHPMAGLYRFKTGFGGKMARRPGSWDYPLRTFAYSVFRQAETIRTWWHKNARKRSRKQTPSKALN